MLVQKLKDYQVSLNSVCGWRTKDAAGGHRECGNEHAIG